MWVGVADSGEGNTGESLIPVAIEGMVTIVNGGGIGFRLNLADGPSRSRILADDVLGELVNGSGNDGMEGTFETGGLRRFGGVERVVNEGEGGGGQLNDDIRLLLDGDGEGFRASEGEMSDAGTGGGGGWMAAANDLEHGEIE